MSRKFKKPNKGKPVAKRRKVLDSEEQAYERQKKIDKKTRKEEKADFIAEKATNRIIEKEKGVSREDVIKAIAQGKESLKIKTKSSYDLLLESLGVTAHSSDDDEAVQDESDLDEDHDDDGSMSGMSNDEADDGNELSIDEDVESQEDSNDEPEDDEPEDESAVEESEDDEPEDESAVEESEDEEVIEKQITWDFDSVTDPKPCKFTASQKFEVPLFDRCLYKGDSKDNPLAQIVPQFIHKEISSFKQTEIEEAVAPFLFSYIDLIVESCDLRSLLALHACNHLFKGRDIILSNNALLAKDHTLDIRDQGFTRAKVLILCATRNCAWKFVEKFLVLAGKRGANPLGKGKFDAQYADEETLPETDLNDHRAEFFQGNVDDNFVLGLSVTKRSIKIGCGFETADLLVCSPLGLRMAIQRGGNDEDSGDEGGRKKKAFKPEGKSKKPVESAADFLSSLEVVMLDRADYLRLQNWEHVVEVLRACNRRPASLRNADISRLRSSAVDGLSRNLRQTIVTCASMESDMFSVFEDRWEQDLSKRGGNFRGMIRLGKSAEGLPLRQGREFGLHRQIFICSGISQGGDSAKALMKTFTEKFWKDVGRELTRLVIVVRDYFDFLQLRKYFKDETDASIADICEFTSQKKLSANRSMFAEGEKTVLILTERLLWYKPLKLKGVQNVLFFGAPTVQSTYFQVISRVLEPARANVVTLFKPEEGLATERLVGSIEFGRVFPGKSSDGSIPSKMTVFN